MRQCSSDFVFFFFFLSLEQSTAVWEGTARLLSTRSIDWKMGTDRIATTTTIMVTTAGRQEFRPLHLNDEIPIE